MAGLWDITHSSGQEGQERINVSLLRTELTGVALDVKTQAEARAVLETSLGRAFDSAELADLTAVANAFSAGATQSRLVYAHKIEYCLNAAELNLIDEATFRSVLGI